jgi:hypothetical protein
MITAGERNVLVPAGTAQCQNGNDYWCSSCSALMIQHWCTPNFSTHYQLNTFLYPQTLHTARGIKTQLLFWPEVPLAHNDNSLLTDDFPGLSTNRIHITAHYKWTCSIPFTSWKQQQWQSISTSSAVLQVPLPFFLPTSPTQPSWFARPIPWTVSQTQGWRTRTTSLPAYPQSTIHILVLGTCMCPEHMILFTYSDLLQFVP